MLFPSPEQLSALRELINSKGFTTATALFILAGMIFYVVVPIPARLDAMLNVLKQGCLKTPTEVSYGQHH